MTAPIVVSSGKGTGNTNQYTQHKRQVFLVRRLRDKRENHVTSGIGLVSRSRVSPVYNQEWENQGPTQIHYTELLGKQLIRLQRH